MLERIHLPSTEHEMRAAAEARPAARTGRCRIALAWAWLRRLGMTTAIAAVPAAAAPAAAQQPLNLDLERASSADSARPWGWTYGYSAFARPAEAFSLDS